MAKAILVIDLDEANIDISKVRANVKLFNEDDNSCCFAVYKNLPVMYIPNEKILDSGDEYWGMYAGGWNDCLIEIKSVNEDRE